jgi:hypothetical protein
MRRARRAKKEEQGEVSFGVWGGAEEVGVERKKKEKK